jgi:hypothetical protein
MRTSVLAACVAVAACGGRGAGTAPAPATPAAPATAAVGSAGVDDPVESGSDDGDAYGELIGSGEAPMGGSGHSLARRPPPPDDVAHLVLGQAVVNGDLDRAIVRRFLERDLEKLTYCYDKQLLVRPGIHGVVSLAFTIAKDGTVPKSAGHGVDDEVASCMAGVIAAIVFVAPKGGNPVDVNVVIEAVPPKTSH